MERKTKEVDDLRGERREAMTTIMELNKKLALLEEDYANRRSSSVARGASPPVTVAATATPYPNQLQMMPVIVPLEVPPEVRHLPYPQMYQADYRHPAIATGGVPGPPGAGSQPS